MSLPYLGLTTSARLNLRLQIPTSYIIILAYKNLKRVART